jgi:predicted negative regulator of RcsB-dependent stress response
VGDTEPWTKGGTLAEVVSTPQFHLSESRRWYKRSGVFLLGLLLLIVLIATFWTCGRSSSVALERAKAASEHFHEQFNQRDYVGIYSQASQEFQDAGSKDDMIQFFGKVHEKLGNFVSTDGPKNYAVTASTKGLFLTLMYASNFEQGEADEFFVWRVKTNSAQLIKYNVNSKLLLR